MQQRPEMEFTFISDSKLFYFAGLFYSKRQGQVQSYKKRATIEVMQKEYPAKTSKNQKTLSLNVGKGFLAIDKLSTLTFVIYKPTRS